MTVKRYVAESAREALRKVKIDLGLDAIVVSNRPVPGGVEITAMSADSLEALSRQTASPTRPAPGADAPRPAAVVEDDYTVSLSTKARAQTNFRPWQPPVEASPAPAAERSPPLRPLSPRLADDPRAARADERDAVPSSVEVAAVLRRASLDSQRREGGVDLQVAQLTTEMQTIKSLLERQLAGFAWGEMTRQTPVRAQLMAEMLDAGFSGVLTRRLIEDMPGDLGADDGRKWLANAVNRRLRTLTGENDITDRGGVFALVGPTGVGKTTTTAKLAARCVVRYGADRLALLTTDGYRIGAHEQLRIYGRILGVPVHVVRDSEDLRRTLVELRDKHMILIDTVGMSQRDRMVAEQAAMLTRAGEVKRLLLLNATSRGDTLDDVIRAYAGEDLAGCILTKVDETASLAPALDAVVRHGLLLTHVANGQRVPEDLHLPNRSYLLHRAFKQPGEASPHRLHGDEVGMVMPPAEADRALRAA
ncbi:MAG: flagellar biosynthesis protein FlhF [Candidatus Nitricoxidivorans perseverans]|uniref:Flagellar biosynthesis protein FlhF n=1 Tax=Candidatus Nitricoxidivorans perseverans TaxID=2975601 RepID=A0AA49FNR5_9PROT|nr:MAG: flagellar biosynthesis protein FlhF [Candidatus Nitricoxidivorans perseverans]